MIDRLTDRILFLLFCLSFLPINQKRTIIFFDFHFSWFIQGIASETKVLVKVVQCIICQQIIFLKFFLFLSSYIVPEWENHIEQNQQETQKKIWVISKLYKYLTVLFLSSRNSSVSLPSINGQSGSENLMSSSSSKRPSSDGKRKTTASSKQKINRVSEFLFKSHSHRVIIHCSHHSHQVFRANNIATSSTVNHNIVT